ncbi:MAG: hypothetical protein GX080_08150 [Tissierellia bacterium]|nr:hypothetical protein [Tissierellia bacterium]
MHFLSKREQIIIILLIVMVIAISLFNFIGKKYLLADSTKEDPLVEELMEGIKEDTEEESEPKEIIVHISGQVNNPGIVKLEVGARVIDAVNLAGGLKNEADLDKINLAKKLEDEEKIYIPALGEEGDVDFSDSQSTAEGNGKVNINTCTKDELLSLPGIGEVLADRIIDYREQTPFKNIEDIMNVSGIGEKKFESIKEMIIVH